MDEQGAWEPDPDAVVRDDWFFDRLGDGGLLERLDRRAVQLAASLGVDEVAASEAVVLAVDRLWRRVGPASSAGQGLSGPPAARADRPASAPFEFRSAGQFEAWCWRAVNWAVRDAARRHAWTRPVPLFPDVGDGRDGEAARGPADPAAPSADTLIAGLDAAEVAERLWEQAGSLPDRQALTFRITVSLEARAAGVDRPFLRRWCRHLRRRLGRPLPDRRSDRLDRQVAAILYPSEIDGPTATEVTRRRALDRVRSDYSLARRALRRCAVWGLPHRRRPAGTRQAHTAGWE